MRLTRLESQLDYSTKMQETYERLFCKDSDGRDEGLRDAWQAFRLKVEIEYVKAGGKIADQK